MNDTTRLIVTLIIAAVLVALIYGLGIVGEEFVSVNDAVEP